MRVNVKLPSARGNVPVSNRARRLPEASTPAVSASDRGGAGARSRFLFRCDRSSRGHRNGLAPAHVVGWPVNNQVDLTKGRCRVSKSAGRNVVLSLAVNVGSLPTLPATPNVSWRNDQLAGPAQARTSPLSPTKSAWDSSTSPAAVGPSAHATNQRTTIATAAQTARKSPLGSCFHVDSLTRGPVSSPWDRLCRHVVPIPARPTCTSGAPSTATLNKRRRA